MERGTVLHFDSKRRRKQHLVGSAREAFSLDPIAIATRVCREMDGLSKDKTCWIPIPSLCKRLNLSRQAVVGAAVYAHVRGWIIYTPFSLLLCGEGRTFLRDIERPRQLSWKQEALLASAMPHAARN
jgi:hypothetical protein